MCVVNFLLKKAIAFIAITFVFNGYKRPGWIGKSSHTAICFSAIIFLKFNKP